MPENAGENCPFGPEYQAYWDLRYKLFSKFDQCQVDATGLYTGTDEEKALGIAKMLRLAGRKRVLDVCSGIGCLSIACARLGLRVTAIEINAARAEMARHNAAVYGVENRIDTRVADILDPATIRELPSGIDTVVMDPPWGDGPGDYLRREKTFLADLQLAEVGLKELVRQLPGEYVLMRFPPNFDFEIFRNTPGDKLALVTQQGFLHFYILHTSKADFLKIPDRTN
jgi:methylase of polypeptide subunit release factors